MCIRNFKINHFGWSKRYICNIIPRPHASTASVRDPPSNSQKTPREFYGQRKQLDVRPMKLNLVAKLVRKLSIGNALAQMQFCDKKAATFVEAVLLETHKKAVEREAHPLNLYVVESYVGRGECMKGIRFHGRGRYAEQRIFKSHYFLTLREGKPPKKKTSIEDSWKYRTRKYIQAGPRSIPNAL